MKNSMTITQGTTANGLNYTIELNRGSYILYVNEKEYTKEDKLIKLQSVFADLENGISVEERARLNNEAMREAVTNALYSMRDEILALRK